LKELFVIALLTIARGAQDESDEEEEEEKEASKKEEDKTSSDTETVMVERESKEGEKTEVTILGTNKIDRRRKVIPEVEIPEHLKENVLLRVVRKQLKMLLDEMDNTTEEEWPSSRTQAGASAKEPSSSTQIAAHMEAAKERLMARKAAKASLL
jgi:transitional endoplasmic reticulum ATPase